LLIGARTISGGGGTGVKGIEDLIPIKKKEALD